MKMSCCVAAEPGVIFNDNRTDERREREEMAIEREVKLQKYKKLCPNQAKCPASSVFVCPH